MDEGNISTNRSNADAPIDTDDDVKKIGTFQDVKNQIASPTVPNRQLEIIDPNPLVSPMVSLRGSFAEANTLIKPSGTPSALDNALGKARDNDNLFMLSHNDKFPKEENSISFQNESVE